MNNVADKHIIMWSCPRSRSSVITRAFEQLDDCEVGVLPLYGAYISRRPHVNDVPDKELIMDDWGTEPEEVIHRMTGALPEGKKFSFQKDNPMHALPEFGTDWFKKFRHLFLIREPKEIICSYQKAMNGELPYYGVGIKELFQLFKRVEENTDETPLVIHSDDIVKDPSKSLRLLCRHLDIGFSHKMLRWEPRLKQSKFLKLMNYSSDHEPWFSTVRDSRQFIPYENKEIDFPDELVPVLEDCLPYYEKLFQRRINLLAD